MKQLFVSSLFILIAGFVFCQKNVYIIERICHLNKWSNANGSIVMKNDKQGGLITFSNYDMFIAYTTKDSIDLKKESGIWKSRTYVSEVKSVVELTITMQKKENKYYFKVIYPNNTPPEEFITRKKTN